MEPLPPHEKTLWSQKRTRTRTYKITKAKDYLLLGTINANKLDEIRIRKLKKIFFDESRWKFGNLFFKSSTTLCEKDIFDENVYSCIRGNVPTALHFMQLPTFVNNVVEEQSHNFVTMFFIEVLDVDVAEDITKSPVLKAV